MNRTGKELVRLFCCQFLGSQSRMKLALFSLECSSTTASNIIQLVNLCDPGCCGDLNLKSCVYSFVRVYVNSFKKIGFGERPNEE